MRAKILSLVRKIKLILNLLNNLIKDLLCFFELNLKGHKIAI